MLVHLLNSLMSCGILIYWRINFRNWITFSLYVSNFNILERERHFISINLQCAFFLKRCTSSVWIWNRKRQQKNQKLYSTMLESLYRLTKMCNKCIQQSTAFNSNYCMFEMNLKIFKLNYLISILSYRSAIMLYAYTFRR